MSHKISIFGSSRATEDQPVFRDAVRLGRTLAEAGFTIVNGGYGGLMEATSIGAAEAGGQVIGVTAPEVFPDRSGVNSSVTIEETTVTIAGRIARVVDIADATITLPGSIGTLAEFIVSWNTCFVAPLKGDRPKPNIVVGPTWRRLVEQISDEIGADRSLVMCVNSTNEAAETLKAHFGIPGTS